MVGQVVDCVDRWYGIVWIKGWVKKWISNGWVLYIGTVADLDSAGGIEGYV